MLNPAHHVFQSPPAIIRPAFNQEHALAEIRALIGRRDKAKADSRSAMLLLGQKFIEARLAMPGELHINKRPMDSPAFIAFIEKCGLARTTAWGYMSYARDPARLDRNRKGLKARYETNNSVRAHRRKTLEEVRDLLLAAVDLDAAIEAVEEELSEIKPKA